MWRLQLFAMLFGFMTLVVAFAALLIYSIFIVARLVQNIALWASWIHKRKELYKSDTLQRGGRFINYNGAK